jgi:hypothetical protein
MTDVTVVYIRNSAACLQDATAIEAEWKSMKEHMGLSESWLNIGYP